MIKKGGMAVTDHIYSMEEIISIIAPIARKYGTPAVYLFGSYARGTANANSDIDFLVDTAGTTLTNLFALGALYAELEEAFDKAVDLITIGSLTQKAGMMSEVAFRETVMKEKINIYGAA